MRHGPGVAIDAQDHQEDDQEGHHAEHGGDKAEKATTESIRVSSPATE